MTTWSQKGLAHKVMITRAEEVAKIEAYTRVAEVLTKALSEGKTTEEATLCLSGFLDDEIKRLYASKGTR